MCFVSTVVNQPSVEPYLFCNYQHHPERHKAAADYQRTCEAQCWEAIMASSAAPGFFEEVKLDRNLFLVSE
jgi:calcium-independent phospholipase A2-gamma